MASTDDSLEPDRRSPAVSPARDRTSMERTPSKSRRMSLSSVIRGRISQVLTADRSPGSDTDSIATTLVDKPETPSEDSRSVSRGRDSFLSSGRGGAGNIRRSSVPRDPLPEDATPVRGREAAVNPNRIVSTGRGGAGNIHSPSRDPHKAEAHPQTTTILSEHAASNAEYERSVIERNNEAKINRSTGRGGLGNIKGSRSRSKGPESRSASRGPKNPFHTTGRGGYGNIKHGEGGDHDLEDEERERLEHAHKDGIHSTGRGGAANLTGALPPGVEHLRHHDNEFESSGRGGAGNIRSRSASRDPGRRAPSGEKHGISAFLHKVAHPHHLAPETAEQKQHSDTASTDSDGRTVPNQE